MYTFGLFGRVLWTVAGDELTDLRDQMRREAASRTGAPTHPQCDAESLSQRKAPPRW